MSSTDTTNGELATVHNIAPYLGDSICTCGRSVTETFDVAGMEWPVCGWRPSAELVARGVNLVGGLVRVAEQLEEALAALADLDRDWTEQSDCCQMHRGNDAHMYVAHDVIARIHDQTAELLGVTSGVHGTGGALDAAREVMGR